MKPYEKVVMNTEELDDGSVVVNFDVTDDYNLPTQQGGYVMVRKDLVDECFSVVVVNVAGDVLSETHVPFAFEEVK